ncbi:MAG: ABC transporter ATP-binding protein [Myxococcales bacterium]|nr:ABC transporter ATP-binding protein [Myxococcales bacterium]
MITVEDLVFEYPTRRALFGVSFTIEEGSIVALVGPNGAGKTTLMRCIAALAHPFSGSVKIEGIQTTEDPHACQRRLGYLSDFFGLYDHLTIRQSLYYAARIRGIDAADIPQRLIKTAERLALTDRLEQKAGELSRGLRQRLAVGMAIIHHPKVLLLDEPASGLDPEARKTLSRLLIQLQSEGMTLVVSSHILSELEEYSSHLMVIRDGRLRDFRPLHKEGGEHPRRLRLRLHQPCEGLADILAKHEGVRDTHIEDQSAVLFFQGTLEEQHMLLRSLLQADVPIYSFHEEKENLADLYLSPEPSEVALQA